MVDKRQVHVKFPVGGVVVCSDIGPRPVLFASARFLSNLDGSMQIVAANSTAESYNAFHTSGSFLYCIAVG